MHRLECKLCMALRKTWTVRTTCDGEPAGPSACGTAPEPLARPCRAWKARGRCAKAGARAGREWPPARPGRHVRAGALRAAPWRTEARARAPFRLSGCFNSAVRRVTLVYYKRSSEVVEPIEYIGPCFDHTSPQPVSHCCCPAPSFTQSFKRLTACLSSLLLSTLPERDCVRCIEQ